MNLSADPVTIAGMVTREVRTGERDGARTKIIVARRPYATGQADLWDALTNADRIPRWFLPVSGELKTGGRYQLEGNAGGVVEQCEEPETFSVTWEYGGQVSWLVVTLRPTDDGTVLELAHEAQIDDMWSQFGPGAGGVGWDLGLMGLALHIQSGAPVDPEDGMAFPLTPEGRLFVRTAAMSWAEAAIADGDDSAAARAAAERTIAFYTTMPGDGNGT
ncbi:SRPBCC family protein [Hoyosella sp. YIM 151337]|uniref:SRPBCC family protein n=1 Tax=Hoyosella sp. YIM 151337 TaxID=2992742 RepID=UPI0022361FCA|nr:SRPBCC family protein [Hoyosella sp. YIM 151337]MCW4351767.1 SRPBCC family protein [Hoyosella sp. YIM 151337]